MSNPLLAPYDLPPFDRIQPADVGPAMDTLLVRVVIVPAVFGLLGDRIWWPGKLSGVRK